MLLSPHSAASVNVQQEVRWALETLEKPGALHGIFPLLLPGLSVEMLDWDAFDAGTPISFRDFNARAFPSEPDPHFFERLAREIAHVRGR